MPDPLPPRCARFAPRITALIRTLPPDSPERQAIESRMVAMRPNQLQMVELLLKTSVFAANQLPVPIKSLKA